MKYSILLFILFSFTNIYSQNQNKINNIKISKDESSLVITFDLNDLNAENYYDIGIKLFDSSSYKVYVKLINGGNEMEKQLLEVDL